MKDKLIQNFLRHLIDKGVSRSSLKYYKSDISSFLSWTGSRKIDSKLVREYINSERLTTPVSTLNRRLSTLRNYANFIGHDFMSGIENVTSIRSVTKSWQDKILLRLEHKPNLKNLISKILFNRPNWYRKYHSYPLANYIHIAILILFSSISGYAVYDQVFYSTDRSLAFPTALTRPNRYLSFQGRLTDNLGNPKTVATNIVFKLYDASSGGSTLWNSGTCSITPDQDGIFSTLLGSSCGAEIASSVFSENAGVWLGVTVAADSEATPRIQIATVGYALNSETLQGYPAGTGTSTIPYINSSGVLVLANASPTIQSTSGTFAVEGLAMTLTTPNTSNGVITINPDGTGTLNLTFEGAAAGGGVNGFINATNANITSGSLYGGTVASNATGYNFIDFQSGAVPASVFSVQNDGDILTSGDVTISGGNINTGNIALTVGDATTDSITLTTDGTGNGEVVLPNDSIGPNEILSSGQTDEYCLTYETTATTFEWQTCGAGGMTSFTAAGDTGANQTISDSNTFSILGGTNGIDTVGSATDTITLNLDATEIGTTTFGSGAAITWTFDASAGTDTTLAFGDNLITVGQGLTITGTTTANGTLDANGVVTLGDNGDTIALDSSDWDIDASGNQSNIGTIGMDGDLTNTQADPSILLVDSTAASDDFSINVDASTFTIKNTTDTRTDISIDGSGNLTLGTITGNAGVVLPNDTISPNEVFTTSQTDEYCLTYEATGTTWEWQSCAGVSSIALDALTASTTDDTAISSGDNTIEWNWALTSATSKGFTIGESAASTGGSGDQHILRLDTAATSTAGPLEIVSNSADGGDIEFNLASAGDFEIQDNGTAYVTFDDGGGITFTPTAGADFILNEAAGTNFQIADSAAATVDLMSIISDANTTTDGVDAMYIDFRTGNGTNPTNSAIHIDLTSGGGAGDTLNGIDIALTGTSGTERGLNFTDNNFDSDINALTDLTVGIGGTNETILTSSAFSPATTDSNALGTTALMWSDLFLADSGVINYNNGGSTITYTSATDQLDFAASDYNFELVDSESMNIDGDGSPNVDILQIGTGDISATDGVDALQVIFDLANADGDAIDISFSPLAGNGGDTAIGVNLNDFSFTSSAGTDIVQGINIGTLTESGTITSTAINLGTGWDTLIGGTTATTNLFSFTNATLTSAGNLSLAGTTGLTFSSTGGINLAGGTISDSSDEVDINDDLAVSGVLQAGGTSAAVYSRFGTGTTGHAGNLTAANDLLISSDLELDGNLYLDGGTIANSAGTATIVFSSSTTDTANTLSASNWLVENTANVGQAALMVNQTKSGDLFTASASGTPKFTITNSGRVGIGTNLPSQELDVAGDIQLSGLLYDTYVTSGIRLGNTNETALSGFGATSIVGALNELKSSSKYTGRNDYLSWANHYKAKAEGTNPTENETLSGLFFDTFQDSTKMDSVNSTSSAALKISDSNYRVGIMGGQTYDSATADNDGQTYLGNNAINDIYYYDRSKDSTPEVLVELGIDPNWYNGVTLSVATTSANYSQNGTLANKNPNLTTTYNGSLVKATGTDSTPRTIYLTIKTPTTFDWTNYQGDSATGVTITPGTAQTLGSTGVSVTFTGGVNYNVGDVFKVASWFIEAEGANRGAKQQFPERANIIATSTSLDIIDADTQKLWIAFDQNASGYALGIDTNNDPSAASFLNGKLYVSENGSSATGLYTFDFSTDSMFRQNATDYRLATSNISDRNAAVTYNVINTSNTLVTVTANDVATAVIPNQKTQEITVNGWGYVVGDTGSTVEETVRLPYTFNDDVTIVTNSIGATPTTTTIKSLSDCDDTGPGGAINTTASGMTNSSFLITLQHVDAGALSASVNYCYSWTATGKVSPKQLIAVATGATNNDGGLTVINETDGLKADLSIGSQDALTYWHSKVAIAGNTLYSASSSSAASVLTWLSVYDGIHGSGGNGISETSTTQKRTNFYYVQSQANGWSAIGPVIKGTAATASEIRSLEATANTSDIDSKGNTIYVGTPSGLSVINEKRGPYVSYDANGISDGSIETGSSVKYYTKDHISEEMIGDIRGMWPFNTSSASLIDTSIKGNYLEDENAPTYSVSAVRGTGLTFDGTADHLCSDSDNNGACDVDTDYAFTTGSFSISSWFKHGSVSGTDTLIDKTYTTTPAAGDGFRITMNSSGNIIFGIDDDATSFPSDSVTSNGVYTDDLWHHVVAVKNGTSSVSLYIDGQLVGSDTSITANSISDSSTILGVGSDCSVGAACATGANFWDGEIDELTITATALTPAQIKNMYQVGYRALQSHGTTLGGGAADSNQQLGYISTGTNTVGVAIPDFANQYVYVGLNSTTLGGLSKIQINSDTNVRTYDSTAAPNSGTPDDSRPIIDEDVTSLGVGYQLEAVGSAASGVKGMAPDNNAVALTGSLFSKTQTLSSSTKFAYFWTSVVTDSSDSDSAINVYACNSYATKALCDSNNAWVLGTLIQTDTNQSPPEREYNFAFSSAGSYLTFKIDFKRTSTKTNTYIERYGATWASSVGGADLAERYKSNEPVYPGDIVTIVDPPAFGEATVGLSKSAYDRNVIGIVTTNPGIVMDDSLVDLNFNAASRNSPDRPAVALSGRVPIKVSTANGEIEVGDPITTSEIPGVGIKATKAGNVVAKALEAFKCEPLINDDGTETKPEICEGKVLAFVNVSWYDPDAYLTEAGDLRIKGFEELAEDGTTTRTVYKIVRIAMSGVEEMIEKIGVFKSVSTKDLETNIISPIADSDLIIDLDPKNSTDSAKLAIKGVNDEEVASIDALGNATFDGTVNTDQLVVTNDATISGTLYVDDIESKRIEDIEKLLKEVETNQSLLAESSSWETNTATESANLDGVFATLTANQLFVTEQLAATSLFVSDNFTTKNINSLNETLQIQSLAQSPLEIMAGKITVDTNGDTKFMSNVEIAGDLTVNNIVVANNINPVATESANIIEGVVTSNSTAGKAILTANSESVRINNTKVKDNSLIYVTPITSTQNRVLYVKSKGQGYFEIGFSESLDQDVEFNWWIIELKDIESQFTNE